MIQPSLRILGGLASFLFTPAGSRTMFKPMCIPALLALSGLALIILPVYHLIAEWRFLRRASKTTGSMVERVIVGYWDEEPIFATAVQYVVCGSTHEIRISARDEESLGAAVDIAYDPARPGDGRECNPGALRSLMILVLVGLLMSVLAGGASYLPATREAEEKTSLVSTEALVSSVMPSMVAALSVLRENAADQLPS